MHAMVLRANFRCSEFILGGKIGKVEGTKSYCELQDFILKKKGSNCENEILEQSGSLYCPGVVAPI